MFTNIASNVIGISCDLSLHYLNTLFNVNLIKYYMNIILIICRHIPFLPLQTILSASWYQYNLTNHNYWSFLLRTAYCKWFNMYMAHLIRSELVTQSCTWVNNYISLSVQDDNINGWRDDFQIDAYMIYEFLDNVWIWVLMCVEVYDPTHGMGSMNPGSAKRIKWSSLTREGGSFIRSKELRRGKYC